MVKRLLEGHTPTERAQKRQQLGSLQSLTVQPATRKRYTAAVDGFLAFCNLNQLTLPTSADLLDPLVCDYVEHLWSQGSGRAIASDCLAGLQDQKPKLKGRLPGAWRLLKTWAVNEIPNRAPPLPEHVLLSLCGWATFKGEVNFAISLLVGYYGMLRTGELLNVKRKDFVADQSNRKILLSLGLTKSGKRVGAAESVVLAHDKVVKPLSKWLSLANKNMPLTASPAKWRAMFNEGLTALKLESFGFRPYSLRRGGATWWFSKHHSLDQILIQGRWQAAKTARLYINEGLAVLASISLPPTDSRLVSYLSVFHKSLFPGSFATLEPPHKFGRSGGRGKGQKPKRNRQKKGGVLFLRAGFVAFERIGVWPVLFFLKK